VAAGSPKHAADRGYQSSLSLPFDGARVSLAWGALNLYFAYAKKAFGDVEAGDGTDVRRAGGGGVGGTPHVPRRAWRLGQQLQEALQSQPIIGAGQKAS